MFWLIVGLVGGFLLAVYLLFSSLTSDVTQFTKVGEREVAEIQDFLDRSLDCNNALSTLKSKSMDYNPSLDIPRKDKIVVVSEKKRKEGLTEVTVEGRLDGQLVTFWIREGNQSNSNSLIATPFILYLRGLGPYNNITETESLLVRDEFSIVVPYILGDAESILDFRDSYDSSTITFQTYVLAKITSVMDYIAAAYDSPKIIAYGEEWGSVLAREIALVDPRIDLVITNKFPGDPLATVERNGFYTDEEFDYRFYEKGTKECHSIDLNSFIGLSPDSHIYLGPKVFSSYYSIGTRALADFLETVYEEAGFPENFTYIELDDLDKTGTEEVINSIHANLYISN